MGASMEFAGLNELVDRVKGMGIKSKAIEERILMKAAEPILEDAVANAPVRSGKGKAALKISRPKSKGDTKYVLIGIDKSDISEVYYMKFQEWGASPHHISADTQNHIAGGLLKSTSKKPTNHPGTRAKPFLQPAKEKNRGTVLKIMKSELKKELGL